LIILPSGPVLLICIPPKVFSSIFSRSEAGLQEVSRPDRVVSADEIALTKHIDHFLEVLLLFEHNQKEM
jgi:hypothetical protein